MESAQRIFAATLTPMTGDLSLDHERLARHCRWLLVNGCDGIVVLGSTGEANALSVDERTALVDQLTNSDIPTERLIVGTGCCAAPDTVTLTQHALARGVRRVLLLPPFYYKRVTDDGLFAAFENIIQQIGDESLRIFLYHIPQMTGIPFSLPLIERLIATYPNTVAGIKDSGGDPQHTQTLIDAFPTFQVYAGTEAYLLDVLRSGGAGCITATLNATCRLARDVAEHQESGEAENLQERLTTIRQAFEAFPFIPGLKGMMARWTGDPAWENMRPPHLPLAEKDATSLANALKVLDFRPPIPHE
jgi:4-hydroxy-tetrahydrodipicolinate synthase